MTNFAFSFLVCCFFSSNVISQNLIADPSFENFGECPEITSVPEYGFEAWEIFRGSPNIYSECDEDFPVGWNSPWGFQTSRSGLTHIGLLTYFDVWQAREYPATALLDSLEIGQDYYLEFHVSLGYNFNVTMFKSNNLGVLLMTENYFTQDEMDPSPNYAHFNVDTMVNDTTNWVKLHGHIVADSAYKYLALGNFFDDSLTTYDFAYDEEEDGVVAYYYIDDVCISADSALCDQILSSPRISNSQEVKLMIYPNPILDRFTISLENADPIKSVIWIDMHGRSVWEESFTPISILNLTKPSVVLAGIYLIQITTADGKVYRQRVFVQ